MRRAYKFRLRPTARQHVALGRCLASHRELYNAALQERRDAWRLSKTAVRYGDQSAQLKQIREVRPDVAVWSFSSQQATLRRLNRAFASFFRRVKAGETPGYPRFRSAQRFDSVEWPEDGDGCRWHPNTRKVYLQGIGQVKITVHRQVKGRVKTIQVRREGRRWMLILSCDEVPTRPLEPTQAAVGVDVGIASFATTSDGQCVPNPGYGRVAAARLATANRPWPVNGGGRPTVVGPATRWRLVIARLPTSAATSTTRRPGRSSPATACWSWRTCGSATWSGDRLPVPILTSRAGSGPTGPPPSPACTEASMTRAGLSSCRSCAPKRKRLAVW